MIFIIIFYYLKKVLKYLLFSKKVFRIFKKHQKSASKLYVVACLTRCGIEFQTLKIHLKPLKSTLNVIIHSIEIL